MRVLLTGASGFIGKNFLLRAPREWEILGVYNQSATFDDFLRRYQLNHVQPVKCDLTHEGQVREFFHGQGHEIDVCLYLAALVNIPLSVEDPAGDHRVNVGGLLNFLKYFRGGKLVYMSSGAVYDGHRGPVDPTRPVNPTLPYGISKLAAEHYVKCYHERKRAFESYVILRFYGAFGPYEAPHKIYTKLVKAFALQRQREFTIYGDGTNLIDAMYVDDAIEGLLKVVTAAHANVTVDFTKGEFTTIEHLVRTTAEIFGVAPVRIHKEGVSNERILWYSFPRAMEDLFGFQPRVTYEEGIRRLADFLSKSA